MRRERKGRRPDVVPRRLRALSHSGDMQMRRVITFALVMALTYLGVGAFAPAQPMSRPGPAVARLTALAGRPGFRTVRYAGYTIRVPASWPVYRLDRAPGRCVRYDQHAVYLGQPGASQQCPAHLVGHTATISIEAAAPGSGGSGSGGPGTGSPVDVGPAIGTVPQVGGSVTRNAADQQLSTSLADPGGSVTGTYTGRGGRVLSILRSLRRAATGAAQASAAPGRSRGPVMTRWAAPLATGTGQTAPSPRAGVPLRTTSAAGAAVTLRTTRPGQHRHPRADRARRHRQARRHPGSRHKTSRPRAAKHHSRKHGASNHRARKHAASKHKARKHKARKHKARKHKASKH